MKVVEGRSMAGTPSIFAMRVRPATSEDREFAFSLVPRLVATTPVHWRNPRKLFAAYLEVIQSALLAAGSHAALLVAEPANRRPMGIALLAAASDCYTHRCQGHLAQIAIVAGHESSAQRTALFEAARQWARARGYVVLTSDRFSDAHPATALCRPGGMRLPIRERQAHSTTESNQ